METEQAKKIKAAMQARDEKLKRIRQFYVPARSMGLCLKGKAQLANLPKDAEIVHVYDASPQLATPGIFVRVASMEYEPVNEYQVIVSDYGEIEVLK
jgi:hypothetical protein